jgi:hypothetical protein
MLQRVGPEVSGHYAAHSHNNFFARSKKILWASHQQGIPLPDGVNQLKYSRKMVIVMFRHKI